MKKNLRETIKMVLEAYWAPPDEIAQLIRDCLKDIYTRDGGKYWGKLQDVENDCQTREGVINIFHHLEGVDNWSILNRLDTNRVARGVMKQIYENDNKNRGKDFSSWIWDNRDKLFGINGEYTQTLLEIIRETVNKGNVNEKFAEDALRKKFGNVKIKRYCSGDVRDTLKGVDMSFNIEGRDINVQVKPMSYFKSLVDSEGDTFFEVGSNTDTKKYSEKNIDVFLFVNTVTNQYVGFQNKKSKIGQYDDFIKFYEPALLMSENLETIETETKEDHLSYKLGSRGNEVKLVQWKMGLEPTGNFDNELAKKIRDYKIKNKISPATHYIDNKFWKSLFGIPYTRDYDRIQDIFGITKKVRIKNLEFRRNQIENRLKEMMGEEDYLEYLYSRKEEIEEKIDEFRR